MRVDEDFLDEVGLGDMPSEEKAAFIDHAEEELEVRVGQSISAQLSDVQMDEFEQIQDSELAARWLDQNVPDFREIVREVFEHFKQELRAERANILA